MFSSYWPSIGNFGLPFNDPNLNDFEMVCSNGSVYTIESKMQELFGSSVDGSTLAPLHNINTTLPVVEWFHGIIPLEDVCISDLPRFTPTIGLCWEMRDFNNDAIWNTVVADFCAAFYQFNYGFNEPNPPWTEILTTWTDFKPAVEDSAPLAGGAEPLIECHAVFCEFYETSWGPYNEYWPILQASAPANVMLAIAINRQDPLIVAYWGELDPTNRGNITDDLIVEYHNVVGLTGADCEYLLDFHPYIIDYCPNAYNIIMSII